MRPRRAGGLRRWLLAAAATCVPAPMGPQRDYGAPAWRPTHATGPREIRRRPRDKRPCSMASSRRLSQRQDRRARVPQVAKGIAELVPAAQRVDFTAGERCVLAKEGVTLRAAVAAARAEGCPLDDRLSKRRCAVYAQMHAACLDTTTDAQRRFWHDRDHHSGSSAHVFGADISLRRIAATS